VVSLGHSHGLENNPDRPAPDLNRYARTAAFIFVYLSKLVAKLESMRLFEYWPFKAAPPSKASVLSMVRTSMLDAMSIAAAGPHSVIRLRVTYAHELQDLWYMRGEVMEAIAAVDGEAVAKRKLAYISQLFTGYLPRGLATRPSPLDC
jgi:hypothetical protein